MPASYAHIFFGNTVYHHLTEELQQSIGREKALFEIGLQGPDILFFYRPLRPNPVSAIGVQMQRETGRAWFTRSCKELARQKGDYDLVEGSKAYIYGVLCYYVLNASCWEYIERYAGENDVRPEEIEGEFDRSIIVRKHKDPASCDLIPGFHPSHRAASIIALFYPGLGVERTEQSLRSFKGFHQVLRSGSAIWAGLKRTNALSKLCARIPAGNPDPRCEKSNEELLHCLRAAVPGAVRLIEQFSLEEVQEDPIFARQMNGEEPVQTTNQ